MHGGNQTQSTNKRGFKGSRLCTELLPIILKVKGKDISVKVKKKSGSSAEETLTDYKSNGQYDQQKAEKLQT